MEELAYTDVPNYMKMQSHASPKVFNRETRRGWIYKLKKKRGSGYTVKRTHIKGMHGNKVVGTQMAIDALSNMFAKIPVPESKNKKEK